MAMHPQNSFGPNWMVLDIDDMSFQQDGATCHAEDATKTFCTNNLQAGLSLEEVTRIGHKDCVI